MPRDPRDPPLVTGSTLDNLAGELSRWLIHDARFLPGNPEILSEFCERVAAAGVPIDRVSLHQRAFHPQYRGVSRIWHPGQALEEKFLDHGIEKTATYLESPVRLVVEEQQSLNWHLDGNHMLPFPVLEELREEGFTHYEIEPLVFAIGIVNAFAWATKRPGGFTAGEMQLIRDILPAYAAVTELKALRRFIGGMLTTYIGAEAGRLILDGQVRRGDVREITAALMLVDLRDFTLMSDTMRPRAVIAMLNEYFDCVIPPVHEHGGEVVEIMGDGVLAIFQQMPGGNAVDSCRSALAAATQGLRALAERNRQRPGEERLYSGAALHYGAVSYGNIGVGERLDFTVIGPDVNLTSRIEHFCRELDCTVIMSEAFVERLGRPMWELGHFAIRGFSQMQRLFTLPEAG